jgi:hypothetical protein
MKSIALITFAGLAALLISAAPAAAQAELVQLDFTSHWAGITALLLFVFAYALVIAEETIHFRKSKPIMVAAGRI